MQQHMLDKVLGSIIRIQYTMLLYTDLGNAIFKKAHLNHLKHLYKIP